MKEQKLKEHANKHKSAISCSINKDTGEALIYVNPNAESTEIIKSLTIAGLEIAKIMDRE